MNSILVLYIAVIIASIGQVIIKAGLNRIGELTLVKNNLIMLFLKLFSNPVVLIGLLFYGISAFLWLVGLSKTNLSKAYPLMSLSYVIVFFFSWLIFRENISILKIIALAIICLGIFLLSKTI